MHLRITARARAHQNTKIIYLLGVAVLSEQSALVVRATLPAVGAAIGNITELFYRKLFDAHPELLRDVFNRGNQANGEQQRALAGSIAAFAGLLLEKPDARPDAWPVGAGPARADATGAGS
ncbi:hypothetical protein QFZ82_000592 [Streptomyces sp. V4I23]|nr:hypothetical protein [Streptomyces sp. V4I23]